MNSDTRRTLEALKSGEITVDEAMLAIKKGLSPTSAMPRSTSTAASGRARPR